MSTYIRQLREEEGQTQDYLAKVIGVSRPTYISIEQGKQIMNVSQAQKMAKFYGLSIEDIIEERVSPKAKVILETDKSENNKTQPQIRISVPQNKVEKFKETLLYILEEIGARPNIGKAVLCKILYFIDFDYYEKYEEQLIGATYIKNHFGPTAPAFPKIVKEMEEQGEILSLKTKMYEYDQQKYLPMRKAELKNFSAREKEVIDKNIERFKDFNAKQIEAYSHKDVPWITAENGKIIDYESVFYRTPEFSQRNYDEI